MNDPVDKVIGDGEISRAIAADWSLPQEAVASVLRLVGRLVESQVYVVLHDQISQHVDEFISKKELEGMLLALGLARIDEASALRIQLEERAKGASDV